ncbi:ABC transporter, permease protein [Acidipropionibacterium acidipropionici ATCC 4875]|uniref:ABC transporter, permease protein n=1 Tax=Acidipropionibacterium acidipropionici (strain ATCC 4875 / DSM 20272 / JCM 6432 / NBRC 12425 / NCIMB 8070 / 4) TaxID=1171373 RepID=K7RQM9_ACIA4|nr:ABC transporter permease subunit [Acidipropionibacterium acidipropionici]AFV88601.1 ABC transporter, permease protein [Acidipropionibacterium acidipropionici ATCC 4875]ALN14066.1 glycine/betaine ABC transporter permease [Acidipropionibacterium acidipropionici]APZ10172.1 glycine/betaine ABC transporter permease [Acidipropionibacterium acidipropionici]
MGGFDFASPRIPLGSWIESFFTWFQQTFDWLISFFNIVVGGLYDGLSAVLSAPLYLIMIVILAAIAWLCASWKVALFTLIGFYVVRAVDQWENTMSTLALVLVAVVIALIIAIPLGILAAKRAGFSAFIKPVLDFMQTMPALAYLVPMIVLFSVGQVPGAVATIIFALPPGVRFTELGIRQVDAETVEAGAAFGASPTHILARIQIPLAMPTIMAGVNQVIMLALSMVVLSGMVGAGGLGGDVVAALSQVDIGLGMEAGVAVVVVAVFLDRITSGLAKRTPLARAQAAG